MSNLPLSWCIYFTSKKFFSFFFLVGVIKTFKRRIDRLYKILENNKRIIFFYSTELCIYNKSIRDVQDINYENLKNIDKFLTDKYKNINYKIINFSLNKIYENISNIINIKIDFDTNLLSDNIETHIESVYNKYRSIIQKK
jgi:hypothetical protein